MTFSTIKQAVAAQFDKMQKTGKLFSTTVNPDDLWQHYLASFPLGSNPIYRTRTEHDCGCCKQFIRNLGGVVSIKDGEISTIWDCTVDDPAYQAVTVSMANYVRRHAIDNKYLHYERHVGTDKSFEQLAGGGQQRWDHFFVNLPAYAVAPKAAIGPALAQSRSTFDVSLRGFSEITNEAIDTVLELIAQNSLYRGEEHKRAVEGFKTAKRLFDKASYKDLFVWEHNSESNRIRNTAIGTLLVDLSEGVDMEAAVKAFESKVAPTNYKRPTALVTKAMITSAAATVEELGLTSALERRYAVLADITVANVLFADRAAKKLLNVFDDLSATASAKPKNMAKIEEITIDKFVSDVLPLVDSIEVMFEGRHVNNLVSLVAPIDATAGQLFKWGNRFSWSYNGEVTDSIKERVKAAGGRVEGDLCCRLAWHNTDDLDFHMHEPDGHYIYYSNRRQVSACGGVLDLDANGVDGPRTDPAENIVYAKKHKMKIGDYQLLVKQYAQRNRVDVGFEVEIEVEGRHINMIYDQVVKQDEKIVVADIHYDGKDITVTPRLGATHASKTVWGLPTQQFHRAKVVMASPNHWDGETTGNKHWFFMLDGAVNDGTARGFYNEFLKPELDKHRKVLELVGSKTKVADNPNQLSGLGFSSTQRNTLTCRVSGKFTRTINITF